jgi:serine phosphatase RsbU (regulator of sigma subunit)/tetratricopeptide (TPR) repeat protein
LLNGQNTQLESLKLNVKNQSGDTIFQLIDAHLEALDSSNAPVEEKLDILRYRVHVSDSLKNRLESLIGYQELSSYGAFLSSDEYFKCIKMHGNAQASLGNIDQAMEVYFTAVTLADSIENDTLLAEIYRTIGIKYKNARNPVLALKYLDESLKLFSEISDSVGILNCYMTIGNAYKQQEIYDSALVAYNTSLEIANTINYARGAAGNYNNMGSAYIGLEEFEVALEHFFMALEINQAEGNDKWVSYNYNNIGDAYYKLEKYDQALLYFNKSIAIKTRLGDDENKIESLEWISEIYAKKGNYKNAYKYLIEHLTLKNSFQDAERLQMADELEARFQNEIKESEINALKAEQTLQAVVIASQTKDLEHQEELRAKEANLIYALGFIMLSLLVTIFVFWRNNRQKRQYNEQLESKNAAINQANHEIEMARENLERKNKEVTDSINYAKRIQAAILPSEKTIASYLNEAFVLYLPKDIVAGDFYWTERVGKTLLFAVADCTGHGVPGAMVSVICHNALNSCIKQLGLTDPGEILDETTQLVLKQFERSEQEVRDGMDIALCSFNTETRELKFAGANTPLWLVRNDEVLKFKATRQPVGNHTTRVKFDSEIIPIQKGDILYLSSDGYSDQFGGEKGKKFLNKRFKSLLVEISKKPISKQAELLKESFLSWKNEYEQVDDVCVMGARVD